MYNKKSSEMRIFLPCSQCALHNIAYIVAYQFNTRKTIVYFTLKQWIYTFFPVRRGEEEEEESEKKEDEKKEEKKDNTIDCEHKYEKNDRTGKE